MRIYLGSDHGGYEAKEVVKKWLMDDGNEVVDKGASALVPEDDFADFAEKVAEELQQDVGAMGILFCRNGVGMSMAANRYMGVRCALGFDEEQVRRARNDDDVNCLSVPTDYIDEEEIKELVSVFLETEFSGEERFKRRLSKLAVVGGVGCEGGVCIPKYGKGKMVG